MNKQLIAILQYIFFIALAGLFVWLSLRNIDDEWDKLKEAFREARYYIFIPVLLLLLLSHWIRGLRWKMLIEPLGHNPSTLNTFFGVMVGYFVNLGAPRLGEIVKCTVLARYERIPADKLIGTIVAERAFDLVCLLAVFGITFLLEFNTIGAFAISSIRPLFSSAEGKFSPLRLIIIVGSLLAIYFVTRFLINRFLHIDFVQRIKTILLGIWKGLTSIKDVKNKGLFLFYTISIWALYLFSILIGFNALKATSELGIGESFSVLSMGSIGMILPSPGGIGTYPWFVQQTVALYGIPEAPYGQALGWLLWFGQFVIFVAFGVISFVLLPVINKKKYAQS